MVLLFLLFFSSFFFFFFSIHQEITFATATPSASSFIPEDSAISQAVKHHSQCQPSESVINVSIVNIIYNFFHCLQNPFKPVKTSIANSDLDLTR